MAESFKTRAAPRPCDASARRRQSTTPRQEACRGAVVVVVRKPSSVPTPGRPSAGGNHSSRANVAVRFVSGQPRGSERAALPTFRLASFVVASLCGLAPDGVCRAVPVTGHAVGSYPTLSPLPRRRCVISGGAVCFLLRFPRGHPHRALPGVLPCGARTFLPSRQGARPAIAWTATTAKVCARDVGHANGRAAATLS